LNKSTPSAKEAVAAHFNQNLTASSIKQSVAQHSSSNNAHASKSNTANNMRHTQPQYVSSNGKGGAGSGATMSSSKANNATSKVLSKKIATSLNPQKLKEYLLQSQSDPINQIQTTNGNNIML